MTWYDIRWNGSDYVLNVNGGQEKELTLLGIHGYATEAEAKAHVQSMNALQAAAGGANILAGVVALPGVVQPGNIAAGAGNVASTATSAAGIVGGVIKWLSQGSIWERAAEFGVGALLLYIGLKASVTPGGAQVAQQTAGQTAKRALKGTAKAVGYHV